MKILNADKDGIVSGVSLILEKRRRIDGIEYSIERLKEEIRDLASETVRAMDNLKKDMTKNTTMNIKINDDYYKLTQNGTGVEIEQFDININN